jgi:hypothetical protein
MHQYQRRGNRYGSGRGMRYLLVFFLFACTVQELPEDANVTQQEQDKAMLVIFAATYCSACRAEMPILKERIADVHGDRLDIWVNVIDQGRFNVDVPQGFDPELTYEGLTGQSCRYVPSWVLLDEEGNLVNHSCGTEKSLGELLESLQTLFA